MIFHQNTIKTLSPLANICADKLGQLDSEALTPEELVIEGRSVSLADRLIEHMLRGGAKLDPTNMQIKYQLQYADCYCLGVGKKFSIPDDVAVLTEQPKGEIYDVKAFRQRIEEYFARIEFINRDAIITMTCDNMMQLGEQILAMSGDDSFEQYTVQVFAPLLNEWLVKAESFNSDPLSQSELALESDTVLLADWLIEQMLREAKLDSTNAQFKYQMQYEDCYWLEGDKIRISDNIATLAGLPTGLFYNAKALRQRIADFYACIEFVNRDATIRMSRDGFEQLQATLQAEYKAIL